jgi:hypothetical protein
MVEIHSAHPLGSAVFGVVLDDDLGVAGATLIQALERIVGEPAA